MTVWSATSRLITIPFEARPLFPEAFMKLQKHVYGGHTSDTGFHTAPGFPCELGKKSTVPNSPPYRTSPTTLSTDRGSVCLRSQAVSPRLFMTFVVKAVFTGRQAIHCPRNPPSCRTFLRRRMSAIDGEVLDLTRGGFYRAKGFLCFLSTARDSDRTAFSQCLQWRTPVLFCHHRRSSSRVSHSRCYSVSPEVTRLRFGASRYRKTVNSGRECVLANSPSTPYQLSISSEPMILDFPR